MKNRTVKRITAGLLALTMVQGYCTMVMAADGNAGIKAVGQESGMPISIDRTFLKAGEALKVDNAEGYKLKYFVDGTETESPVLKEDQYEEWIRVDAFDENGNLVSSDSAYFSRLPVIYINTEGGKEITSKTEYRKASMNIQNNTDSDIVYSGEIQIKGRGNTSWYEFPKRPYRIKLDRKTDLFGMGKNKNWVLLANFLDESLLRNTTAFQISEKLGLTAMQSVWTDVILNGEYMGNYQLCEQIRIGKSRVDIFDWEEEAEKIAGAVSKAETDIGRNEFEEFLKNDLSWVTDGIALFHGRVIYLSEYYPELNLDYSTGYLFELSNEYDEDPKFMTNRGLKVMVKSPESLNSNQYMTDHVASLWNDLESAYCSDDGYVQTAGGKKHYSELADLDSMVAVWLSAEIPSNYDSQYKSRFAYTDNAGLIRFGPVWDYDYAFGSSLDPHMTVWRISKSDGEGQCFFREFLDDPLFICRATEKYWEIRPFIDELMKDGGILDKETEYLKESGAADQKRWDRNSNRVLNGIARGFETDSEMVKTFLKTRMKWMDGLFASDSVLLSSLHTHSSASPYVKADDVLIISVKNAQKDNVTEHAPADWLTDCSDNAHADITVTDGDTVSVNAYVNGIYFGSAKVEKSTVSFDIPSEKLDAALGKKNVISFIGKDKDGNTTHRNFTTVVRVCGEEPALTSAAVTEKASVTGNVTSVTNAVSGTAPALTSGTTVALTTSAVNSSVTSQTTSSLQSSTETMLSEKNVLFTEKVLDKAVTEAPSDPAVTEITEPVTSYETSVSHCASDDELCEWAAKDFKDRTGTAEVNAEIVSSSDEKYEIKLTGEDGSVLGVYSIDPVTGTGTDSEGEKIDLPQTGRNSPSVLLALVTAFALAVSGSVAMAFSGKKKR